MSAENTRPIDHVRNLVASMLQEAIAARDRQRRALSELLEIQARANELESQIATAVSDRQTSLNASQAHVDAFAQELKVIEEIIKKS